MNFHPLASIFPLLEGAAFDELVADVRAHGVREPIWTLNGEILDGRNRWRAAQVAGRDCPQREYEGDEPAAFVVSLNLHRRHLSESQRAMVAARLANMPAHRPEKSASIEALSQTDAAELLNVSRSAVQRARAVVESGAPELAQAVERGAVSVSAAVDVAELPQEEQREIVAKGKREILQAAKQIRAQKAEARRKERTAKLVELSEQSRPLGGIGKFPVIYADPPWRYEHSETEARAIENQYPTMSLDDIRALPVADVSLDDCVLFLWATSPKLHEAMSVLDAWGFTYRSCAVWDKEVIGMGYYFRQQHELLLVATKGTPPTPAPADRPSSVIRSKREAHSKKPEVVYELIEQMYPTLPKLEMFCRSPREAWSAWGNEASAA